MPANVAYGLVVTFSQPFKSEQGIGPPEKCFAARYAASTKPTAATAMIAAERKLAVLGNCFIEDRLEGVVAPRALDPLPVEIERRRSINAGSEPALEIALGPVAPGIRLIIPAKLLLGEPKLAGIPHEHIRWIRRFRPYLLVLKERVMHLPEFSLERCGLGGARGGNGVRMLLQRKMAIHKRDIIRVVVGKLPDERVIRAASRTLKIAVFDEDYLRGRISLHVIGRADGVDETRGRTVRAATGPQANVNRYSRDNRHSHDNKDKGFASHILI